MLKLGGEFSPVRLAAISLASATLIFSGGVKAQVGDTAFRERHIAYVMSAEPAVIGKSPQVRLPALVEAAERSTVAVVKMPEMLAAERGEFDAEGSVQVVVGTDGSQANCQVIETSIRRGKSREPRSDQPISLPLCELLQQEIHFRPAINADGEPIVSRVKISLNFSRSEPVFVPPPPPAFWSAQTSGHVLKESGFWADRSYAWYDRFVISAPNWAEALSGLETLPKVAKVGVTLKLVAKDGAGTIASCNVVMPSKDARLDAATCKALVAGGYSSKGGYLLNGPNDFPVLVEWDRSKAAMTAPALVTVPHMPKDVTLLPKERPAGTPPALRAIPIQIELDGKGTPTGCTVMQSSGNDAWDAAGCRIALKRARFTAPLDSFGLPANGLYQAIADWNAMVIRPQH